MVRHGVDARASRRAAFGEVGRPQAGCLCGRYTSSRAGQAARRDLASHHGTPLELVYLWGGGLVCYGTTNNTIFTIQSVSSSLL